MTDLGWTADPAELLRYRVLLELRRDAETTNADVIATRLDALPEQVGQAFQSLEIQGLVKCFDMMLGDTVPTDAVITPAGRAAGDRWLAARSIGGQRRACRAAMLDWLYGLDGRPIASVEEILKDPRGWQFGVRHARETVWNAARDLLEVEVITGLPTFNGPVLRPAITDNGRTVVERYDGDVTAWRDRSAAAGGSTNITVTGSSGVTVANQSPGAQQSVHVTNDAGEQLVNLSAALKEMIPILGLSPEDVARAYGIARQLAEAAEEPELDRSKVTATLETLKAVAVNGTGSAAGTGLVALAVAAAHALG